MLQDFIAGNRDLIIDRTRARVKARPWPSATTTELEHGVPLFLTQLMESLRLQETGAPPDEAAIVASAARHGAELLANGLNVSQVVHDYGDICQVVTDLATDQQARITSAEFHTLNRCLDVAIAEAVTEHARITAQVRSTTEVERLGQVAHEMRDVLNTAFLAFHMLRRGTVAINGSTGEILGRSLMNLRAIIERSLSEVGLDAGRRLREPLSVKTLVENIAASGFLHSEYRKIGFTVSEVDPSLIVYGDPQLLTSALMNLLHNAFKYTPTGGHVTIRTRADGTTLLMEVEDQCGGIAESNVDLFKAFGDRRGMDRTGLGLGLSIARKVVQAHNGDITIRNIPGQGCIFIISLPMSPQGEATRLGSQA